MDTRLTAITSDRPQGVAGRDRLDPQGVIERVRAVLPHGTSRAALHEPTFAGREREYLADCIDTGWVSYAGAYVGKFEVALAQACGVDHAVALTSGTVALQVALAVAGLNAGEEVLLPSLTFVASANAVVHAGGTPHFVDVDEATLGIAGAHLQRRFPESGNHSRFRRQSLRAAPQGLARPGSRA